MTQQSFYSIGLESGEISMHKSAEESQASEDQYVTVMGHDAEPVVHLVVQDGKVIKAENCHGVKHTAFIGRTIASLITGAKIG